MDRFGALKTFITVAEELGFSRAATELGISKSVASRQITALEEALGAHLLRRTTRTVELTEQGQAYFDRAKAILADLEAADKAAVASESELAGPIRIAAPVAFGTSQLSALAAAFMARHPKLVAEIILADRLVEPSEEGFDLALRIVANAQDADNRMAQVEMGLFAAPDYLSKRGRPQAPSDLNLHDALVLGERSRHASWHLRGQIEPVAIVPRLASNNASAVRGAALAGLGIALLPLFVVADDVRNGHLVRVLDGFEPKPQMLCVDYPEGRIPSAKTRLFVEFLSGGLARDGV